MRGLQDAKMASFKTQHKRIEDINSQSIILTIETMRQNITGYHKIRSYRKHEILNNDLNMLYQHLICRHSSKDLSFKLINLSSKCIMSLALLTFNTAVSDVSQSEQHNQAYYKSVYIY